jgi:hypothetical protein
MTNNAPSAVTVPSSLVDDAPLTLIVLLCLYGGVAPAPTSFAASVILRPCTASELPALSELAAAVSAPVVSVSVSVGLLVMSSILAFFFIYT